MMFKWAKGRRGVVKTRAREKAMVGPRPRSLRPNHPKKLNALFVTNQAIGREIASYSWRI